MLTVRHRVTEAVCMLTAVRRKVIKAVCMLTAVRHEIIKKRVYANSCSS
jgi:hypothetical protein